jgi:archaellin
MPLSKILNDGISANQSLSLVRVLETANVYATPIGGNVNIDISNNTVYLFNANTTANLTFNFRANSTSLLTVQFKLVRLLLVLLL